MAYYLFTYMQYKSTPSNPRKHLSELDKIEISLMLFLFLPTFGIIIAKEKKEWIKEGYHNIIFGFSIALFIICLISINIFSAVNTIIKEMSQPNSDLQNESVDFQGYANTK